METQPLSPATALEELLKWVFEQNEGKWNSITTPDVVVQAAVALEEHHKKPCPDRPLSHYASQR